MDYKEKYETAIEKIKGYVTDEFGCTRLKPSDIFPELEESEDERIREFLLDEYQRIKEQNTWANPFIKLDEIIAYLEKQEKYSSSNFKEAEKEKTEHVSHGFMLCKADYQDFKEGEHYWLEYLGDDKYNVRSDNLLGKTYHITPQALYLVFRPLTWLEKQKEQKPTELPKSEDYGVDGLYAAVDILQKTLGEVDGYQTDDGILEHKCAISAVKELYEQKANTERDICDTCDWNSSCITPCPAKLIGKEQKPEDIGITLRSLSDETLLAECEMRGLNKPAEWSEEEKQMLNMIYSCIKWAMDEHAFISTNKLIGDKEGVKLQDFLRSIAKQKAQEWSKEDETALNDAVRYMRYYGETSAQEHIRLRLKEIVGWLLSIPNRIRPQSHWKPSSQELGSLRTAVSVLTEERNFPKVVKHIQDIIDLFDGGELRKDWKPSDEQMNTLYAVAQKSNGIHYINLMGLYTELKEL